VIALSNAVIRYSDYGDADAYLQQLFAKVAEAGLGDVANEITRVLARKSTNAVVSPVVVAPDAGDADPDDEVVGEGEPSNRPPPKRRRTNATFDIEERKGLAKCTSTAQKMEAIRAVHDTFKRSDAAVDDMVPALRSAWYSVVDPVMNCFLTHCNGSVDEFTRRWGSKFGHSNFGRDKCPGKMADRTECGFVEQDPA
jgi:hypothetical protein